jgi:hypothetical protein
MTTRETRAGLPAWLTAAALGAVLAGTGSFACAGVTAARYSSTESVTIEVTVAPAEPAAAANSAGNDQIEEPAAEVGGPPPETTTVPVEPRTPAEPSKGRGEAPPVESAVPPEPRSGPNNEPGNERKTEAPTGPAENTDETAGEAEDE